MICIAITVAAFEAAAATLPLGSAAMRCSAAQKGSGLSWLEGRVIDKLSGLGGHGESYSEVILRLTESRVRP